jgi:hypothetical protein
MAVGTTKVLNPSTVVPISSGTSAPRPSAMASIGSRGTTSPSITGMNDMPHEAMVLAPYRTGSAPEVTSSLTSACAVIRASTVVGDMTLLGRDKAMHTRTGPAVPRSTVQAASCGPSPYRYPK